jgi:hypothetical protein
VKLLPRRSRFLKVENRHEDLICESSSKTNLLNTFLKFGAFFSENEILGLYSGPKATIYTIRIRLIWISRDSSQGADLKNVNLR